MGRDTNIAWCDSTWNPWMGCSKVSAGCAHCYAEALMDTQYGKVQWGEHGTRVRTSPANWREPLKWNREAEAAGERKRVFCASLADVFEDRPELDEWRIDLFRRIDQTPWLDWLLLTKRPHLAGDYIRSAGARRNIWLGTSVENQETADERIPHLLKAPAAVRFLSCEPLLGPVDFWPWLDSPEHGPGMRGQSLNWVIVGGESGHGARPFDVRWARKLRDQCNDADVPFFLKQIGASPYDSFYLNDQRIQVKDKKGGDWSEWPADLRVRQFPEGVNA